MQPKVGWLSISFQPEEFGYLNKHIDILPPFVSGYYGRFSFRVGLAPKLTGHGVTQCVTGWQQTQRLSEGAISAVILASITVIPLSLGVRRQNNNVSLPKAMR